MMKRPTSIVLSTVLFLVTVSQSGAGLLSTGDYVAEPDQTIIATIELSSLGGEPFTSMDIAIEVTPSVGSGASPTLGTANASTEDGWAWSPFSDANDAQQTFNLTNTLAVYGVSGEPLGVVSRLDGIVLEVPISVPADAVAGDVFLLDLLEDNSNISNAGVALTPMAGWTDGSITIIPEPSTAAMLALSLFGLVMRRRR